MSSPNDNIAAEAIARIARPGESKRHLKNAAGDLRDAVAAAGQQVDLAIGVIAQLGMAYEADKLLSDTAAGAVDQLLDAHMALRILDRLEQTVAGRNGKPVSAQAVAWAIRRTEIAEDTSYRDLRDALQMYSKDNPPLSPDLRARLIDEMRRDNVIGRAAAAGVAVG